MTKAQALALVNALEGQQVGCDAQLRFAGVPPAESWSVLIDPALSLTGAQLAALAQYCAQAGLVLSAQFSYLGIV